MLTFLLYCNHLSCFLYNLTLWLFLFYSHFSKVSKGSKEKIYIHFSPPYSTWSSRNYTCSVKNESVGVEGRVAKVVGDDGLSQRVGRQSRLSFQSDDNLTYDNSRNNGD